jgi:cob(I)alamin adenosyltransferase
MKIYTKKGDHGETSLIGGTRVKKSHWRIEAYGTVDELNSFVGLIRDTTEHKSQEAQLIEIQNLLFTAGSALAATSQSKMKLPSLKEQHLANLEQAIDSMNEALPELRNFILPGGDKAASYAHVARTVCRRAERKVVGLAGEESVDPLIIKYLNRLSDYLFTLARFLTHQHQGQETIWKSDV